MSVDAFAPPAGARLVDDPDELAEYFSDAPAVHIYALCDLEEPFWTPSSWFRRGDAVVGLVSLPGGEGSAVYAVSTRDPQGAIELTLDLLPRMPSGQLVTAPVGLADALASRVAVSWSGPHERHHLVDVDRLPEPDARVRPLDRSDIDALQACYDVVPGAAFFLPHMLDDDTFVGIWHDGGLIAAAGTHVVSSRFRCAAIGAVFAHPDHRGEGLGRAVTAAVAHRLLERGDIDTIGLNVSSTNAPAKAIYERIGFSKVHEYEEAGLA